MFSKTLFINLVLISLILLGTWYTWQQLTRPAAPLVTRRQADVYATQVSIFHTDSEGNLYDQLKTPLSVHYPLDNSISLATPVFNLFEKNNESWELSARYGKLKENNDFLQLWNNVRLKQKKGVNTITTLTTSTLTINLKEKTAQTADPVTIIQTNQVIQAIGLHADFKKKTIQLLSQVKGQLQSTKEK
jgi:lipopolysaccharide export system protein LptC